MPTKTPSTPTKTPSTPTKTPSTPTKTPSTPIFIYAVLSRSKFCCEFTHFFGVLFTGLENASVYKK